MRSRVMPGSSPTIERRAPTMRLKSVDLPTFGRPTIVTSGNAGRASTADGAVASVSFVLMIECEQSNVRCECAARSDLKKQLAEACAKLISCGAHVETTSHHRSHPRDFPARTCSRTAFGTCCTPRARPAGRGLRGGAP